MTVGRWEWRGAGEGITAAEARLEEGSPHTIEESDELYLLSVVSDASVKVRGDLLDVKRLVQVSDAGLEQWMPIAKDPFPVSEVALHAALVELGVDVPLEREAYALAELLGEVAAPCPDLHAVRVHKTRRRYTVGGCMAEVTDMQVDGRHVRTIAVESDDHDLVLATLRDLGARPLPNVSVPRALKRELGVGPRRFAVIDVGTNSVKLLLAERPSRDGSWRELVDRSEVTRLGEGLARSGRLQPQATARTIDAIEGMAIDAWRQGAERIAAVGTAGLRVAGNTADFLEALAARCGIRLEVISGEEEARLSFLAAASAGERVAGPLVVFETGGGSTQFTFGRDERVLEQFSVQVGAVRLTERFGLDGVVEADSLAEVHHAVARELGSLDGRPTPAALLALGGAVTNLAAVAHRLAPYDAAVVRGSMLDLEEIDRQIELYRTRTAEQRREIVGLQPGRAEIILAGACIVRAVVVGLGRETLTVSDRGLRHRLLVERFNA